MKPFKIECVFEFETLSSNIEVFERAIKVDTLFNHVEFRIIHQRFHVDNKLRITVRKLATLQKSEFDVNKIARVEKRLRGLFFKEIYALKHLIKVPVGLAYKIKQRTEVVFIDKYNVK